MLSRRDPIALTFSRQRSGRCGVFCVDSPWCRSIRRERDGDFTAASASRELPVFTIRRAEDVRRGCYNSDLSNALAAGTGFMPELNQSPLNSRHLEQGARMVEFAGWSLPVQYTGISQEATAVRRSGGVFDISHMGQLFVRSDKGTGSATGALDRLLTSKVTALQPGQGQYTLLLNEQGRIIDDLIVYRLDDDEYFLVVNAARVGDDVQWIAEHLPDDVRLDDVSSQFGAIAVQGRHAPAWFESIQRAVGEGNPVPLPNRFGILDLAHNPGRWLVCRTGYTGEDGFELFCTAELLGPWWDAVVDTGAVPAGLGARDILRLEKCYPLNGSDLTPERTPLECGLRFAVDLGKPDFIGRTSLMEQQERGLSHRLVAVRQTGKAPPPRAGYSVLAKDQSVGVVTSGGVSPALGYGIALAWVQAGHHKAGTVLTMEIRSRRYPCEVVRKPFLQESTHAG